MPEGSVKRGLTNRVRDETVLRSVAKKERYVGVAFDVRVVRDLEVVPLGIVDGRHGE